MRIGLLVGSLACAVAMSSLVTAQQSPRVFRSGVDLVRFSVAVLDAKGKFVKGLTSQDFQVIEDGKPQNITFFSAGEGGDGRAPLHLGLLFDTSESMMDDLKFSKTAAVKFVDSVPEASDVTFVDFDTEVRVARYTQDDFPRLVERIRGTKPEGWTALYDAMGVYLHGASDQDGDKVLVVYTDGGDTRSNVLYRDVTDMLKASDVTAFCVGLLDNQPSSVKTEQRLRLQEIASITGGQALFPSSKEQLDEMYAKIVEEVQARYSLGYLSSNEKTDGAWRRVDIKVTRPGTRNVRVRTRTGYFAPYRHD